MEMHDLGRIREMKKREKKGWYGMNMLKGERNSIFRQVESIVKVQWVERSKKTLVNSIKIKTNLSIAGVYRILGWPLKE